MRQLEDYLKNLNVSYRTTSIDDGDSYATVVLSLKREGKTISMVNKELTLSKHDPIRVLNSILREFNVGDKTMLDYFNLTKEERDFSIMYDLKAFTGFSYTTCLNWLTKLSNRYRTLSLLFNNEEIVKMGHLIIKKGENDE